MTMHDGEVLRGERGQVVIVPLPFVAAILGDLFWGLGELVPRPGKPPRLRHLPLHWLRYRFEADFWFFNSGASGIPWAITTDTVDPPVAMAPELPTPRAAFPRLQNFCLITINPAYVYVNHKYNIIISTCSNRQSAREAGPGRGGGRERNGGDWRANVKWRGGRRDGK